MSDKDKKDAFIETAEIVSGIQSDVTTLTKKFESEVETKKEANEKLEKHFKESADWRTKEEKRAERLDEIEKQLEKLNRPDVGDGSKKMSNEELSQLYFKNIRYHCLSRIGSRYTEDFKLTENELNHLQTKIGMLLNPFNQVAEFKSNTGWQGEQKAIDTETFTRAGALVAPPEMINEIIIQALEEISPIRQLATKERLTLGNQLEIPSETAVGTFGWVGETGTRSENTTWTHGKEVIPVHEMYALVKITHQMLEDAAFDMRQRIINRYTKFAEVLEGNAFVAGNGILKPEGINTNGSVGETNQGEATTLTNGDGLISLWGAVKEYYTRNANWLMRRATLATISKLKGGDGQYLFGRLNDMPGFQIMGAPVLEAPDVPAIAANAFPVFYGDFSQAYTVVDKTVGTMLIEDPYSSKTTGIVEFLLRRRVGGQVVNPEAIRKLKIAV